MPSDNMPRIMLPDGVPVTEEPAQLPLSRSPTNILFGGRGLLAVPPQRDHEPPMYVPLVPTDNSPTTTRKWTQEDQDETDEKARRKAMNELVASWMDRLQLISVIVRYNFLCCHGVATSRHHSARPWGSNWGTTASQLANATLTGALVVHVFAAILSFLAAFFLIRYKLTVAKREERKVESGLAGSATNVHPNGSGSGSGTADANASCTTTASSTQPIWSSNPHLEQVGPFRRGQPPTHLLDHLHSVCMWLSIVGFVLALAGVLCFAWSRLALSGGVFASVCMVVCLVTGVAAVFWPASSAHH
ncbi:hypothetical protein C8T65DRAFT_737000 [Cerioporus squamosus]|nr:hypothetical protein C8T65DRAFT_737000 [Cerioporus squamosus]